MSYSKPTVIESEGMAEGVFMASGTPAAAAEASTCHITTWINNATPTKFGSHFKYQVGWCHTDEPGSNKNNGDNILGDLLTFTFDMPVTFYDVWGDILPYPEGSADNVTTFTLQVKTDAIGNRVSDIHVDCANGTPTLLSFTAVHGSI